MMGRTGIGNSQVEVVHVTIKVLRLTSKQVVMFKKNLSNLILGP
jgi:hypothetical protein